MAVKKTSVAEQTVVEEPRKATEKAEKAERTERTERVEKKEELNIRQLQKMTIKELQDLAKKEGEKDYHRLKKQELNFKILSIS
ncbi:MAG: Rho termination factor N-terminal domain-containing protein [Planctomycetota bacterium]